MNQSNSMLRLRYNGLRFFDAGSSFLDGLKEWLLHASFIGESWLRYTALDVL
jgi:hypothetical protein